jgi:hypothetical protein
MVNSILPAVGMGDFLAFRGILKLRQPSCSQTDNKIEVLSIMYSPNSFLPDSMLIGAANESIENAENYFSNQNYPKCANEVAKAAINLSRRDSPSSGQRGMNIIRACGLPLDEFNKFKSMLPTAIPLGDTYVQVTENPQIDRETAEFLLNYVKEVISKIQRLE